MKIFIAVMLAVAGIIHLLPLAGVLGADKLSSLYGLGFTDSNLVIVMRHRAVLFGLLGAFLLYAALRPALQPLALIAGYVSVLSFLWLAWSAPSYNAAMARVVTADLVALACLFAATVAYAITQRTA
jgi:hypothetical protein